MATSEPRRFATHLIALAATATGWVHIQRAQRLKREDYRVFVLEYHEVADELEREGVVNRRRLRRHLESLERDYEIVSLSTALRKLQGVVPLTRDAVVVTFDDGCAGNHAHGLQQLQQLKAPATVFVTTGFVDGDDLWFDFARQALGMVRDAPSRLDDESTTSLSRLLGTWPLSSSLEREIHVLKYATPDDRASVLAILDQLRPEASGALKPMTWDQIRELQSLGHEIGCHTVSHPILSTLPRAQQEYEISESRRRLTDELGNPPRLFAYPNGSRRDFNQETLEIVESSGFEAACTTIRGPNLPGGDPYQLRRIGVGADSCMLLRARLSGLFDDWLRRRIA